MQTLRALGGAGSFMLATNWRYGLTWVSVLPSKRRFTILARLFFSPTSIPQRFYHRPASGISSGLSLSLPLVLFVVPFFHSVGHHPLVIVVAFLLFSQVLSVCRGAPSLALRCLAAPVPAQALSQALKVSPLVSH